MNRRNFLSNLAKSVGLFTILPPATTYSRIWKATIRSIPNPDWTISEWQIEYLIATLPFELCKVPILFKRKILV